MTRSCNELEASAKGTGLQTAAHILLFSAGALHWLIFLNFGDIPLDLEDWAQERYFYSIFKQALMTGTFPLHVAHSFLGKIRFMAIPLTVLAPHIVLLRWLTISQFILVHVLIFYGLGYWGGVVFMRRYGLSWRGFLLFFILFNFNGYVTSHQAVGHTVWCSGYFLLPWFFLLILEWVRKGPSISVALALALTIFAISLPGSFHICTWCMIFLALLAARKSGWSEYAVLVAVASAFLVAYRLLPGWIAFRTFYHGSPVGYPSLPDMLAALVSLRSAEYPVLNSMRWWEYDMYVGPLGFLALAALGAAPFFMGGFRKGPGADLARLDLPLAGMVLLSYGEVYYWILGGLPVLGLERAVTRLLIVPLVLLVMLAALRFDHLANKARRWAYFPVLTSVALAVLAGGLLRHSWTWRVAALRLPDPPRADVLLETAIKNRPDPEYVSSLLSGASITLIALVGIVFLLARYRRRGGQKD